MIANLKIIRKAFFVKRNIYNPNVKINTPHITFAVKM